MCVVGKYIDVLKFLGQRGTVNKLGLRYGVGWDDLYQKRHCVHGSLV